ncbi:MAG TPA: DNA replication/repair protein RecF [Sandaracinaceae bacterium LLY-WYZ-13_1]|nr:DNA replication/repair protein RecF [Sandaracinaceae bacterium LLY-WYZ-13_1]
MSERPALRLDRLALRGFRNLVDLDLAPGPRFNVLSGDNGQGKSNLLEAIHYLGALESFRLARKDDLIAHGAERAVLAARFETAPAPVTAKVRLDRRKARSLALNDKRPRSTAAWVASLQMVLFHPGDLSLASGSPDGRRRFLDRILEQMDPTYAKTLASYGKALRSRNRLLKREDADRRSIVAYDELLASAGAVVGQSRARLIEALKPLTESAFGRVSGEQLPLSIDYRPRVEPEVEALREALARSLTKDLARGFTAEGPHGDDLALTVHQDRGARHHASQGQHRMMVLALKVAELEVLTRRVGRVPILLLDDVSSELDATRNRRLFELLDRLGGQVFLTTTHRELIRIDRGRVDFRVEAGRVEGVERPDEAAP